MLTMEQVYRIRNMKKYEGKSVRKIASITGHDFKTVKSILKRKTSILSFVPSSTEKESCLLTEVSSTLGLSVINKRPTNSNILQKECVTGYRNFITGNSR